MCYLFLETQIDGTAFGGQGSFSGVDIIVLSFLVSVLIAIVAVIAGVGGVKITPPPTPAITATIAINTLTKKEITMMSRPERLPCPPNAMPSICVSRNR